MIGQQRWKLSSQDQTHAHAVPDLVKGHLLSVQYVASQDNAADALTTGLGATTHRKARLLL
eukprot:4784572-Prorocentrum_lima.AAC.1